MVNIIDACFWTTWLFLQIKDLLPKNGDLGNVHIWSQNTDDYLTNESIIHELNNEVEVVQQIEVKNPIEFSNVLKSASKNRGTDTIKFNASHLYGLCLHSFTNILTYVACVYLAIVPCYVYLFSVANYQHVAEQCFSPKLSKHMEFF